ncbi:MAG TPA: transporter substrate-binding domain-containing protein [Candidatus Limnocylindrales bacterium]|nr:transporter substrate-binding domain-containing protein [Candidatus Limnocylindrales bacterium]
MRKTLRLVALSTAAVLLVAACSSGAATPAPATPAPATEAPATEAPATEAPATEAPTEAPATINPESLLGKVIAAGEIRVATDPNYAPFSFLDVATGEYVGFDNAVAVEMVKRLSTEVGKEIKLKWETPSWDLITAGSWGGRWDLSVGSMSVTVAREKVVDFVDPYYYDFGVVAVPKDSTVQSVAELAGKTFCVGASTTYEQWLTGTLEISDPNMLPVPEGVQVTTLPTDNECIQALGAGRKYDALAANENSLANAVKEGQAIRILDNSVTFTISVSPALDKSGPATAEMLEVLNKVIADMHADGTLTKISIEHLEKDVTQKP